jgi:hypothetical protein
MGLHSIPGYDAWKLDHPDNHATDPAECPEWLAAELRANPVFVGEALDDAHEAMRAAFMAGSPINLFDAATKGVESYIAHWWETGREDAEAISAQWKRYAAEAARFAA